MSFSQVIAVSAYSAQFQYPLTIQEIQLRLLGAKTANRFFELLFELQRADSKKVAKLKSQNPVFNYIKHEALARNLTSQLQKEQLESNDLHYSAKFQPTVKQLFITGQAQKNLIKPSQENSIKPDQGSLIQPDQAILIKPSQENSIKPAQKNQALAQQQLINQDWDKLLSCLNLQELLITLTELNFLKKKGSYYYLAAGVNSNKLEKLVEQRQLRERQALKLKQNLGFLIKTAKICSWIKAVGITGSTAVKNADPDADIDLMVVAQRGRLWLTRWILLAWALLLGKKRWPWQKNQDDWCINLLIDEENLVLPKTKHNLFSAYEACQIDWIYDDCGIQAKFYSNNLWIKEFLPNWYQQLLKKDGVSQEEKPGDKEREHIVKEQDLPARGKKQKEQDLPARGKKQKEQDLPAREKKQAADFSYCLLWQKCLSKICSMLTTWIDALNLLVFKIQSQHLHKKNQIPLDNLRQDQAFLHGKKMPAGWS